LQVCCANALSGGEGSGEGRIPVRLTAGIFPVMHPSYDGKMIIMLAGKGTVTDRLC